MTEYAIASNNFEITGDELIEVMLDCEVLDMSKPLRMIGQNKGTVKKVRGTF